MCDTRAAAAETLQRTLAVLKCPTGDADNTDAVTDVKSSKYLDDALLPPPTFSMYEMPDTAVFRRVESSAEKARRHLDADPPAQFLYF